MSLSAAELIADTLNRWAWSTDPYAIEIKRRLEALAEAQQAREALQRQVADLLGNVVNSADAEMERDTLRGLQSILTREQAEKIAREAVCPHSTRNVILCEKCLPDLLMKIAGSEDTRLLDWLEEHCDDLAVTRDISAGTKFAIDWCSDKSGCPVGVAGYPTLRAAVRSAIKSEEGK